MKGQNFEVYAVDQKQSDVLALAAAASAVISSLKIRIAVKSTMWSRISKTRVVARSAMSISESMRVSGKDWLRSATSKSRSDQVTKQNR